MQTATAGLVARSCAAAALTGASSATSPRQSSAVYSPRTASHSVRWRSVGPRCVSPHSRLWPAFHACVWQARLQ